MKVYEMMNLDGVNACMVAAKNLKEAAELMDITPYQMRRMGWRYASDATTDPITLAATFVALTKPGVCLYRPITPRAEPWREKRYSREEMY